MKNETIQMLKSLEEAYQSNPMIASQVSVQDIIVCTIREININRSIIPEATYFDVINRYKETTKEIQNKTSDCFPEIISLSLMVLNFIPDTLYPYLTQEWWRHQLKDNYSDEYEELRQNMIPRNGIGIFNYPFFDKYASLDIELFLDEENAHHYVMYKGKRMYFPTSKTPDEIIHYCRFIYAEQDAASPHSYQKEGYNVKEGDVILDAGVAEGNFALDHIDIASHIYLIEADPEWVDALQLTFKDYSDKVTIIPAFLDSSTFDNHVCIDDLNLEQLNYIKMDIEGSERDSLIGAVKTLEKNNDLRFAICSYHKKGDEEWIRNFVKDYNFTTTTSGGFMFMNGEPGALINVNFRRGIVFGKKINSDAS